MRIQRNELVTLCAVLLLATALAVVLRPAVPTAGASGAAPAAVAAIPVTFNYQGILRAVDGSLITGDRDITFKIYDSVVGGNQLHNETVTGVAVRDGVFNVVLGDVSPIGSNVFADAPRYLGIAVAPDPEMVPRQRLHPVPWAVQANQASHASAASTLVDNASVNGLTVNSPGLKIPGYNSFRIDGPPDPQTAPYFSMGGYGAFHIDAPGVVAGRFMVTNEGNVGIGTASPANRLDVAGNVAVGGDLKVKAIREVGDSANNGQKTQQLYDVSLRRYVLEATDGGNTPTSVPVDENLLQQLCRDEDGCTFTLGMRDWNTTAIGHGLLATVGPIRLSLGQQIGSQRYWDVRYENGDQLSAADGNGETNHLRQAWSCLLTDGRFLNGVNTGDQGIGLELLNWYGEYDAQNMVCVLIIED